MSVSFVSFLLPPRGFASRVGVRFRRAALATACGLAATAAVAGSGIGADVSSDFSAASSLVGSRWPARPTYWQTRGNGFVFELQGPAYRMFEVTRESLLPIGTGEVRNGTLLHHGAPVMPLRELLAISEPLDALPRRRLTNYTADPVRLFETFWTTIDENYAFFDLAPPDLWRRQYARFRPRIRPSTTPAELWTVCSEMIRPLNDGHTMLFDLSTGARAASRGPAASDWMIDEAAPAYITAILGTLDSFDPAKNVLGNNSAVYGTIGGRVGYLNIFQYEGFAAAAETSAVASSTARSPLASNLARRLHPIPPTTTPAVPEAAFSILTSLSGYAAENAPFAAALDRVFTEFASLDAVIIDLRFNQGGSGDLVVELANRLTARSRLAYTYRVRNGGSLEFEPPVAVRLQPHSPGFTGKPVIVLTSGNTKSAGDLQALILRELPNVTLVGETTYGIFSEGIPRQIPLRVGDEIPGWVLTVSTQRIHSAGGEFLEQRGVRPDVPVAPDRTAITQTGHDNMLETVLEALAAQAAEH